MGSRDAVLMTSSVKGRSAMRLDRRMAVGATWVALLGAGSLLLVACGSDEPSNVTAGESGGQEESAPAVSTDPSHVQDSGIEGTAKPGLSVDMAFECAGGNFGSTDSLVVGGQYSSVPEAVERHIARQYPDGPVVDGVSPASEAPDFDSADGWFFEDSAEVDAVAASADSNVVVAYLRGGAVVYQMFLQQFPDGKYGVVGETLCATDIELFRPDLAGQYDPNEP